jgi:hypothetical protein
MKQASFGKPGRRGKGAGLLFAFRSTFAWKQREMTMADDPIVRSEIQGAPRCAWCGPGRPPPPQQAASTAFTPTYDL